MANTIKFGNGQWATKEDSILAYNDENANFKPLPFVTSRASTATRVNKAGLLETVASGVPRVDYLGNSKGSYLLEPASTNLITQSEAFGSSYWTKSGASIEGDASTAGGSELVSSWANVDFTSFTSSGVDIAQMVSSANGNNCAGSASIVAGKMYKVSFTSSQAIDCRVKVANSTSLSTNGLTVYSTILSGLNEFYFTSEINLSYIGFQAFAAFTDTQISGFTCLEVQGFSAPSVDSPLGAFKLVADSGTINKKISSAGFPTTSVARTVTFYVKKNTINYIQLNHSGDLQGYVNFDLLNSVVGTSGSKSTGKVTTGLINGWVRCEAEFDATNAFGSTYSLLIQDNASSSYGTIGSATGDLLIFGAQLEEQSYATSYIPTSGSQISRLSETASQTVPDGIINSSEGVLYLEIKGFENDNVSRYISLCDGSSSNAIRIFYYNDGGTVFFRKNVNNVGVITSTTTVINQSELTKIAVRYNPTNFDIFSNGVKILTNLNSDTFANNTLNTINFTNSNGYTNPFNGNCKDLRVFNTALTDAELQTLTTI